MRSLGLTFIALGALLFIVAGMAALTAEPGWRCTVVDNSLCLSQNHTFCGVTGGPCKKCDPHERELCVVDPLYSCSDYGAALCTGKQVAQCLPNPQNPSQLTCQGWVYNGDCSPEPSCF